MTIEQYRNREQWDERTQALKDLGGLDNLIQSAPPVGVGEAGGSVFREELWQQRTRDILATYPHAICHAQVDICSYDEDGLYYSESPRGRTGFGVGGGSIKSVGSVVGGRLVQALAKATNWKSVKQFGHTFRQHGAGAQNTGRLLDRARGTGTPQGQWLNNEKAAEALRAIKVDGPATVRIPEGLGQVIRPDGTIVQAEWARVIPSADGLRTAFPVIP